MNSDEYWFWLLTKEELSSIDIRKLLAAYPAPEDIFKAAPEDLITRSGISPDKANAVADPFLKDDHLLRYDRMCSSGIRLIHLFSPEYPEKLKNIPDSPCGLFVKGNLPDPDIPALGMVGARACSGYGSKIAHETARKLSSYGIQTVSGMAVGIDSVCARSTLDAGGKTFAILGSGIDVIYPKENIELYYNIIMSGGGIISEYPMGSVPYPWRFPHRNRLISGLSDVLLVIEAGKRSGTLTTAMHALDQGKDVYALPGRITDRQSEGCNQLIADGAGIFLSCERMMAEVFSGPSWHKEGGDNDKTAHISDIPDASDTFLSKDCRIIFKLTGQDPESSDDLAKKSGLEPDLVRQCLSELELEGLITRISCDEYVRCLL